MVGLGDLDQLLGAGRMDSGTVAVSPHVSHPSDEG